jgi:formylglycine-generating enzyme required for sulfatase activity
MNQHVRASLLAMALCATAGGAARDAAAQRELVGGVPPLAVAATPMVEIPGGTYTLGSEHGRADERPVHTVTLAPFWIDRYEVTNVQFLAFLEAVLANPAHDVQLAGDAAPGTADGRVIGGADAGLLMEDLGRPSRRTLVALNDNESRIGVRGGRLYVEPGFEQHPVNEVTWRGAREFCAWRGARLPTEAEWEAAARGRAGRTYPWGEEAPRPNRAVFGHRSNETEAVGERRAGATPEGVHDLAGNVAEWTSTLYRPYPYRTGDRREDPEAPGERVTRGGDHVFDAESAGLRAAFRAGFSRAPLVGHRHIGFRCAR